MRCRKGKVLAFVKGSFFWWLSCGFIIRLRASSDVGWIFLIIGIFMVAGLVVYTVVNTDYRGVVIG